MRSCSHMITNHMVLTCPSSETWCPYRLVCNCLATTAQSWEKSVFPNWSVIALVAIELLQSSVVCMQHANVSAKLWKKATQREMSNIYLQSEICAFWHISAWFWAIACTLKATLLWFAPDYFRFHQPFREYILCPNVYHLKYCRPLWRNVDWHHVTSLYGTGGLFMQPQLLPSGGLQVEHGFKTRASFFQPVLLGFTSPYPSPWPTNYTVSGFTEQSPQTKAVKSQWLCSTFIQRPRSEKSLQGCSWRKPFFTTAKNATLPLEKIKTWHL